MTDPRIPRTRRPGLRRWRASARTAALTAVPTAGLTARLRGLVRGALCLWTLTVLGCARVWLVGRRCVRVGHRVAAAAARVARWPGWARATRAAGRRTRRAFVAAARALGCAGVWSVWPVALAAFCVGFGCVRGLRMAVEAAGRVARRVAGWRLWPGGARRARRLAWLAWRMGRRAGRLVVRIATGVWRRAEPWVRDGWGWLVHRAPGVVGRWLARMLTRSARWAVRWIPVTVARIVVWALIAVGWLLKHAGVYCVGYRDYGGMVAEATAAGRPVRAHMLRRRWRRAALRRTLSVLAVVAGLCVAVLVVVDRYGALAEAGLVVGVVAVLAGIGRALRPGLWAPAAREEGTPDIPVSDSGDARAPYPLADARTRAEAADCVARALGAEAISVRLCEEARRTGWGWEIPVVLRSGTPAAIVAKAGELETHLDLPAGGVLATPDRARRARVVLRLAHTDPFVRVGTARARAPLSATITARAVIGARIDGHPLAVPLAGVHAVVIGSSGAGKSTTLLALADAISACADALVWDFDPTGPGLEALAGAVARREREKVGIADALADALALAEVRPRMLNTLGMGAQWSPSPDRPALVVVVDEYTRLSARAKESAVELLRIGRKARVSLILASTEATSDALGAAIADTTALRILHPCRHTDVRLVLGPQMAAEGWRPDRLRPATADDPGDVGRCYVFTAGLTEPLVSQIAPLPPDEAIERGHHRALAGLPRIDHESWQRARALRATQRSHDGRGDPDREAVADIRVRDDVISVFGVDARLWTEDILSRLAARDDRYTGWSAEDLAAALRPFGVAPVQIKRDGSNRRGYDKDTLQRAHDRGQAGGDS